MDICKPMLETIKRECDESGPGQKKTHSNYALCHIFPCFISDAEGNFMGRFKHRMLSASSGSTFHGQDGDVHLLGSVFDIFLAGSDTTSTFLEWVVLYLVSYPDVQVFDENNSYLMGCHTLSCLWYLAGKVLERS